MWESFLQIFFPSSSGAIKDGVGAGQAGAGAVNGLSSFFDKIKEILNIVLFGRYYPPVFAPPSGFDLIPKLVRPAKDTRVYLWHLLGVLFIVYLFRLAFGNLNFFSRKK